MADFLVRNTDDLPRNKETTAILAYLTASGQTRKGKVKDHGTRQERVSPTPVRIQRVPLFFVEYTAGIIDERAKTKVPNVLNFRRKNIRHNFSDGYQSLIATVWLSTRQKRNEVIHLDAWNATAADAKYALRDGFKIWKVSDTAFGFEGSQTASKYLHALYGYKIALKNPEALQFEREIGTYRFETGTQEVAQLPKAIGGNPPYTYMLEGTLPSGLTYYPADLQIRGAITSATTGLNWVATDSGGVRISEHFDIEIFSSLAIGAFRGFRRRHSITTTLPAATGGVKPYTYSISNVSSTVQGQYGPVAVRVSWNPSTRVITLSRNGAATILSHGNQGAGSLTYTVRDALGHTVSTAYSFNLGNPL